MPMQEGHSSGVEAATDTKQVQLEAYWLYFNVGWLNKESRLSSKWALFSNPTTWLLHYTALTSSSRELWNLSPFHLNVLSPVGNDGPNGGQHFLCHCSRRCILLLLTAGKGGQHLAGRKGGRKSYTLTHDLGTPLWKYSQDPLKNT